MHNNYQDLIQKIQDLLFVNAKKGGFPENELLVCYKIFSDNTTNEKQFIKDCIEVYNNIFLHQKKSDECILDNYFNFPRYLYFVKELLYKSKPSNLEQ